MRDLTPPVFYRLKNVINTTFQAYIYVFRSDPLKKGNLYGEFVQFRKRDRPSASEVFNPLIDNRCYGKKAGVKSLYQRDQGSIARNLLYS